MTRAMGWFGVAAFTLNALACAGRAPEGIGVREGRLAPCPSSPNCVSSDAVDPGHRVEAFVVEGEVEAAWSGLRDWLKEQKRVRITVDEADYLHAVFTTPLLRFRDDVEFHARPERGEIALRSASRVGRSDLGANRKRVEAIRAELARRGLVRAAD